MWKYLPPCGIYLRAQEEYVLSFNGKAIRDIIYGCGMERDWLQANGRLAAVFLASRKSEYVYILLYPRPPVLPKDWVAGYWDLSVVDKEGVVRENSARLCFYVDGLYASRQFELGDKIPAQYWKGSNLLRIRLPRRKQMRWTWRNDDALYTA